MYLRRQQRLRNEGYSLADLEVHLSFHFPPQKHSYVILLSVDRAFREPQYALHIRALSERENAVHLYISLEDPGS